MNAHLLSSQSLDSDQWNAGVVLFVVLTAVCGALWHWVRRTSDTLRKHGLKFQKVESEMGINLKIED
jgi:hypothetical protein